MLECGVRIPEAHWLSGISRDQLETNVGIINGNFRNLNWRYLPYMAYFSGLNFSGYIPRIWPYIYGTNVPPWIKMICVWRIAGFTDSPTGWVSDVHPLHKKRWPQLTALTNLKCFFELVERPNLIWLQVEFTEPLDQRTELRGCAISEKTRFRKQHQEDH